LGKSKFVVVFLKNKLIKCCFKDYFYKKIVEKVVDCVNKINMKILVFHKDY